MSNGINPVAVSAAVEGDLDEIVLARTAFDFGLLPMRVFGKRGKDHVRQKLPGYNAAAQREPWVILVDLDQDAECAPAFLAEWLPRPAPYMTPRIAVRAIESWLLADRKAIADFLSVVEARIPLDAEDVRDPKAALVNIARHSRRSAIRNELVPRPESRRLVGPAYTSRLSEFVRDLWRPAVAERSSESLRRCRLSLERLAGRLRGSARWLHPAGER